jgi:hypothetical protein
MTGRQEYDRNMTGRQDDRQDDRQRILGKYMIDSISLYQKLCCKAGGGGEGGKRGRHICLATLYYSRKVKNIKWKHLLQLSPPQPFPPVKECFTLSKKL